MQREKRMAGGKGRAASFTEKKEENFVNARTTEGSFVWQTGGVEGGGTKGGL